MADITQHNELEDATHMEQTGISYGKQENEIPHVNYEVTEQNNNQVTEEIKDNAPVPAAPIQLISANQREVEDNSPEKQSERGGDNARNPEAERSVEEDKKEHAEIAHRMHTGVNYDVIRLYAVPQIGPELQQTSALHKLLSEMQEKSEEYKKRIHDLETDNIECKPLC
jgi:hypothetical protein